MDYKIVVDGTRYRIMDENGTLTKGRYHTYQAASEWIIRTMNRAHSYKEWVIVDNSNYSAQNEALIREVQI